MIDPNKFAYYGDSVRWFIGRVINNNDPSFAGRVQIRIFGVHSPYVDEVPDGDLPWAQTLMPTTEGGTSGIGKIPQLLPNALVFGIFLDGTTSQLPLIIGHLNQIEMPTPLQRTLQPISVSTDPFPTGRQFGPNGVVVDPSVTAANNGDITQKRMAAMRFFVDQLKSPQIAAGIVGNIQAESNFNISAAGDANRGGSFGICQWNSEAGRFQCLQNYAASLSKDWKQFDVQLQFVMHELQGGEYAQRGSLNCYNKLASCTSFDGGAIDSNSTWIFLKNFEIPADMLSKLPARENYARQAYRDFTGT